MGGCTLSQSQPQFHPRSRSSSSTPRLCHACTAPADEPPPFTANLIGAATRSATPRSKSATKSRSSSKENREIIWPPPRTTLNTSSNAAKKQPIPYPSAWALSPGRSPDPRGPWTIKELAEDEEKKKSKGMMGFLMRRRKKPTEKEEAVHKMRVMGCRLLQWRFVNARRERAIAGVRSTAERKLFFAWLRINELRNIVAAKRIVIQRKKHKLKLARILKPQIHLLNQRELNSKGHIEDVSALSRALETACLPVPLVDGAQVDLVLLHTHISTSMEIMVEIEAAVRIFYSKVEEVSTILSELAETANLAMKGLDELIETSQRITTLEMHETSLRANLIQAMKKEIKPLPLSELRLQSWMQSHQWPIYN